MLLSLQARDGGGNYLHSGETKRYVGSSQIGLVGPYRLVLGPDDQVLGCLQVLDLRIGQCCPFVSLAPLDAALFGLKELQRPEFQLQAEPLCPGQEVFVEVRNLSCNSMMVSAVLSGLSEREWREQRYSLGCSYHKHFVPGCYRCINARSCNDHGMPKPSRVLEFSEKQAIGPVSVNLEAPRSTPRCGRAHPARAELVCERKAGHRHAHEQGEHSWPEQPRAVCGNRNSDRPELVCERDAGHRHAHEQGEHSWPQQRATPSREQLARAAAEVERYLDDGWTAWESPSDES